MMKRQYAIRDMKENAVAGFIAIIVAIIAFGILCAIGVDRSCIFERKEKTIDPCVEAGRGHQIICSGEPCGCTADSTNYRG